MSNPRLPAPGSAFRLRFRVLTRTVILGALLVIGAAATFAADSTSSKTTSSAKKSTTRGMKASREGVVGKFKSAVKASDKGKPISFEEAYPGYNPANYDPDLADVKRGRRIVPKHDITFTEGGLKSPDELIGHIVDCVSLGSGKQLAACTISYPDFKRILWPEFPQSRPAAHITVDSAWEPTQHRNMSACNRACGDWRNRDIKLKEFKVGSVTEYTNFRMYNDIEITVTDVRTGEPLDFYLVRSIVERNGVFKLYSTHD